MFDVGRMIAQKVCMQAHDDAMRDPRRVQHEMASAEYALRRMTLRPLVTTVGLDSAARGAMPIAVG